jgi:putative membrane protein
MELQQCFRGNNLPITLLFITYFVGVLGLSMDYTRPLFQLLTPLQLCFSLFWLLRSQSEHTIKSYIAFGLVAIMGWLVEWVGVHSGLIFGTYYYGDALGVSILDIPLMIGVNWLILTLSISAILERWQLPIPAASLIGGAVLTLIDLLIEPNAPKLDFWYWPNGYPAVWNSAGWFITSVSLVFVLQIFRLKYENPVALPLFLMQIAFFSILLLTLQ